MQNNINIQEIVLKAMKDRYPGASEAEVTALIQDIGQTIMVEAMAKMVDEIEAKDDTLAQEVKDLLVRDDMDNMDVIKRVSDICLLPEINLDLDKILQEVAVDVVKDIMSD